MFEELKRFVVGAPIPSFHAHHQKLGMLAGLAVLSADALSSVAYATEEVLRVLSVGGAEALQDAPVIAGLADGSAQLEIRAYRLRAGQFEGVELISS